MRSTARWVLLIGSLLLSGCDDELSGTYADGARVTQYTFVGNGDVKILVLGTEIDAEYRLDDDKVLVSSAQGTVVLTRRDGHLYGPMGLKLVRQQRARGE